MDNALYGYGKKLRAHLKVANSGINGVLVLWEINGTQMEYLLSQGPPWEGVE